MSFLRKAFMAMIRRICWCVCYFLPINSKKIVVSSYYGGGYGDNLKYIVEEILSNCKNVTVIWMVKNEDNAKTLPEQICPCVIGSLKSIFHLSTAKIWIDNCRRSFLFKKKKQFYIQTWHGFALKQIEKDVESKLGKKYVKTAKKDSKAIDVIISEASFMSEIYRNSFWYSGKIVEWGSPRNDYLINNHANENKVKTYFSINSEYKTILYAPTFRVNSSLKPYSIDFKRILNSCHEKFGNKFVFLLRLHPNIIKLSENLEFTDDIINASYYPDMQELLAECDIVISDYSSLMIDFAITEKPCFQFATDLEDYRADRNFYFELEKLPFDFCSSNDELASAIANFDNEQYIARLNNFFASVGYIKNGNSAQRCVVLIDNIINKNNIDWDNI